MAYTFWDDRSPSHRCDWVDQLRGWAVIVMIEVHCVNTWLDLKLRPEWLNYLNGLVAPSFLMCAGFSLVLSTFRSDGTLRPFWPDTAKRLGFILLCAYALHAPGFTLADWTVLNTAHKTVEIFKIDVLQCVVYSLLILQVLARLVRNPRIFTLVALGLAIYIALISPYLWAAGIADGLWTPIRGILNGNTDRGVTSLFPLFPWMAFVTFGSFLGGAYRWLRVEHQDKGPAKWAEPRYLAGLFLLGLGLWIWGSHAKEKWLWDGQWIQDAAGLWRLQTTTGVWSWNELQALHNTTLPSVADRLGWICMGGAALGFIHQLRPRLPGPAFVEAASRESLLLYMLHLNLIFGVLMTPAVLGLTGWDWNSQGWTMTLVLTASVVGINLVAGVAWQRVRQHPIEMRRIQRWALTAFAIWFLVGGWWTFRYYLRSPELAREPYAFLNAARARKGLAPTPDGLCRDPEEYFREAVMRNRHPNETARKKIEEQIRARTASDELPNLRALELLNSGSVTDPSSSLSVWLGLAIPLVLLYRAAMAALLAAFHALPSLQRRRLLEEEAIPNPMLARLLEEPRSLGMALNFWNQILLVLALGLAWPLRIPLPGHGWTLGLLALVYLWVVDLALTSLLTAMSPAAWLGRLFPFYAPFHGPLSLLVAPIARRIERMQEADDLAREGDDEEVTEDAMTALFEEGEAEGILEEGDRELIRNVVSFGDTVVREVMTPRTRIVGLPIQASLEEAWKIFSESRHSRLPIYDGSIDKVVGVLLLKDLLQLPDQSSMRIQDLMKTPRFVPESKPIVELMKDLQRVRTKLAIVVDEFGGVSGLVTIEDMLEEVFGEIQDEHEAPSELLDQGDGVYLVPGHMHVEDLAERFGFAWERDGFDTIAGLVMAKLGRIPKAQESILVPGAKLTVLRMEGTRVVQMRIEIHPETTR